MTEEEALKIAASKGLEIAVELAILRGLTPEQALREWDILPEEYMD